MPSILIIEDDASQRNALEEYLSGWSKSAKIFAAPDGDIAASVIKEKELDLIVSDLMLPDTTGIDIVKSLRASGKTTPFLILTGQPSIETAVDAIRAGANDYILKPVDFVVLKKKIEALLETDRLRGENRRLRARIAEVFQAGNIIGNSPAIRQVLDRIRQVAGTDVTVLLEGESGTGKELIANVIHENSPRSDGAFIKVNCGALTKTILESELFGVVKGAFTGAEKDRAGYFESATGGTIFLDEIGEMDMESQVRLLRVIEEREVVRVGSTRPVKVDVRVVAATNRSLLDEVDAGRFREDLYYRLSVIRQSLPPLRERREDIPLLFNHFVTQFNDKYSKSVTSLSPELTKFFQTYDWPGNIRQFRNVLEGMVVMAHEDILQKGDLPDEILREGRRPGERTLKDSILANVPMDEYEKAIILKNLAVTGGNREKTAKVLGISERTLYRKIKDFGIG